MICDAWLPLLAASMDMQSDGGSCDGWDMARRLWLDWRCGDAPAELLRLAMEFDVGGESLAAGMSQGVFQGLLGWLAVLPDEGGRGT